MMKMIVREGVVTGYWEDLAECQSEKGGGGLTIAKLFLVTFTFEIIPTQRNVAVPNVVSIKAERGFI